MKEWLVTRGPLVTAFSVFDDFYEYKDGDIYRYLKGNFTGGHCVCCVGYDDTQRYWICKNSWGDKFGQEGYFYIEYGQCGIDALMWGVEGIITPDSSKGEWRENQTIRGLWTNDEPNNAWAYLQGVGWRRIAFAEDAGFLSLVVHLAAARTSNRPVKLYLENDIITQVVVP